MSVKKKTTTKSWPKTTWGNVIERAERIAFRLIVGDSAGTCFAVSIGTSPESRSIHYMFATAWHVVKDIAGSDKPIYMVAADGKTVCEAKAGCYAIFPLGSEAFDTALNSGKLRAFTLWSRF